MAFSNPTRAKGDDLRASQEKEVMVKRLADNKEIIVPLRLADELCARKPAEYERLEKIVPQVEGKIRVVTPDEANKEAGNVLRSEAPKPEAPKPEAPKPEAPKPEAPKPEAPKP